MRILLLRLTTQINCALIKLSQNSADTELKEEVMEAIVRQAELLVTFRKQYFEKLRQNPSFAESQSKVVQVLAYNLNQSMVKFEDVLEETEMLKDF